MAEVAIDTNVLVAWVYENDVHRAAALSVLQGIRDRGDVAVLFDLVVHEATSVFCRRVKDGVMAESELLEVLEIFRQWFMQDKIVVGSDLAMESPGQVFDVIEQAHGKVGFNDAVLVCLHRRGAFDALASFDKGFDSVAGFPPRLC